MSGLTSRAHISTPVRSARIVSWDLILSQFLSIKSLKLLTMDKPKSTCRTFKMVVGRFVAKRDMEGLYLYLC